MSSRSLSGLFFERKTQVLFIVQGDIERAVLQRFFVLFAQEDREHVRRLGDHVGDGLDLHAFYCPADGADLFEF